MANVEARMKVNGKHYEISVNLDEALKIKNGKGGNIASALQSREIYHDLKKATKAPKEDLMTAFGTTDVYQIAQHIVMKGEVQKTQEFRDEEREKRIKQIVTLIIKNATDQNGRPYTDNRIRTALEEAHVTFGNRPVEKQMTDVVEKLKTILPIRIETKRVKITVPANYTGHVYGMLLEYKESEEWLSNGNLQVVVNVPAGLLMEFYNKLNSATHGSIQSEELTKVA